MIRFISCVWVAMVLCSGQAVADSAKAPPMVHGAKVSIQGYGRQNPACATWTDGCVLCIADDDGRGQCSTPGIACTPHGMTCKVVRHAP